MAAPSQHRCVFVGNIPYDATEAQLIQICEEVGPVVSFRLVTDRETLKPKGYGFCEYKDEETALSARRNLQGYEINGRQLRVDFAENDKGTDRNREQGRGGPGMAANVETQKQVGGPAILGDSANQQPIGLSLATAAASIMAGALGGPQVGRKGNQNALHSQALLGSDPLTLHLAKMSRSQLNDILSELKAMATEDKELARQILLMNPLLPKALYQAEIMLGMVTPEMLQMPNIRQTGPLSQPLSQDGHQGQQPAVQAAPGLPPLSQNKMQFGMMPKVQESQASATPQNSLVANQASALPQLQNQPRMQLPHLAPSQVQQTSFTTHSGVSTLPSIRPQPLPGFSARPQIQLATSSSLKQQMQAPLIQHTARSGSANPGNSTQLVSANATVPSSLLTRPPISDPGYQMQPGSRMMSGNPDKLKTDSDRSGQATDGATWAHRNNNYSNATLGPVKSEPLDRPSKLAKLDDGRRTPLPVTGSGPSQVFAAGSSSLNQIPKAQNQPSEQQVSQSQLPPEVEAALLQQVMNLTPEQLSLLPPEQRQQVIQLQQQMLR